MPRTFRLAEDAAALGLSCFQALVQRLAAQMRLCGVGDSDVDLVARARLGDQQAFDSLVRRYQRQAWVVASSTVGDAAEAEDLAQEAFIRA